MQPGRTASWEVKYEVHNLLAEGVVVGRVLLAGVELLNGVQLPVVPSPDLVNHSGLEVHEHGSRRVLTRSRLGEEGVE